MWGVLAIALPLPARAGFPIKECGDLNVGLYVENITSRRTSCRKARSVARRYVTGGFRAHRVGRYACIETRLGVEYWDARCTKPGGWVVHFQFGA
jgi:hypothetical protein